MISWYDEIKQQPEALRAFCARHREGTALKRVWRLAHAKAYRHVVLTGMGSSYSACQLTASHLRRAGMSCMVTETRELLLEGARICDRDALVIVVSQSGESPEVVHLVSDMDDLQNVICVTNYPASRLYKCGAAPVLLHAGTEYGSSTKSYTNTLAAMACIAESITSPDAGTMDALLCDIERAADETERILEQEALAESASEFLGSPKGIICVGSGYSYANAGHLETIVEEVGKTYASRYTPGQFIHGPIELIGEGFTAIILDSMPDAHGLVDDVKDSVLRYGGSVFLITAREGITPADGLFVWKIARLHGLTAPIAEVVPVELALNRLMLKKGERPGNLSRVKKRMAL